MRENSVVDIEEYSGYDGLGLAELVRGRQVTAAELAQLAVRGVERVNPELNAVIEVFQDRIVDLDEAALADGPFRGVPFLLKDLGAMAQGRTQESGSRLMEGFIAPIDSFVTIKFRRSGLNILGRTTCPEFGYTFDTHSLLTGQTSNPWDLDRIAGGSSGGSAAVVAAGVVPICHANDGGGSIRLPASICGLVGLKASRGRISLGPLDNVISSYLVCEGFLSRSVRDTAALLDATRGGFPGDAVCIRPPERPYLEEVGAPVDSLRIAVATRAWRPAGMDPEVESALQQTMELLKRMGHRIEDAEMPFEKGAFHQHFTREFIIGIAPLLDVAAAFMGREISSETVEPLMLKAYERSRRASALEHFESLENMNNVSRQLGAYFEKVDLILTPTMAVIPPQQGIYHLDQPAIELDEFFEKVWDAIPYTPLNNYTGTPAISLPLCETSAGLPIGMHFMAPFGREDLLIRLAAALEAEMPWSGRKPSVHVAPQ